MTSDYDVGVLQARGEQADPHLARRGCRQGSFDHLQPVGAAEATYLNNPIAWLRRLGRRGGYTFDIRLQSVTDLWDIRTDRRVCRGPSRGRG